MTTTPSSSSPSSSSSARRRRRRSSCVLDLARSSPRYDPDRAAIAAYVPRRRLRSLRRRRRRNDGNDGDERGGDGDPYWPEFTFRSGSSPFRLTSNRSSSIEEGGGGAAAAAAPEDDGDDDDDSGPCRRRWSISYRDYFLAAESAASALAALLRDRRRRRNRRRRGRGGDQEECRRDDGRRTTRCQRRRQPAVAVSIPEGPYLPLAILAVHVLAASRASAAVVAGAKEKAAEVRSASEYEVEDEHGHGETYDEEDDDAWSDECPMLVPVDPSDGPERIVHALRDARVDLILCCPGGGDDGGDRGDGGRLREAAARATKEEAEVEAKTKAKDGAEMNAQERLDSYSGKGDDGDDEGRSDANEEAEVVDFPRLVHEALAAAASSSSARGYHDGTYSSPDYPSSSSSSTDSPDDSDDVLLRSVISHAVYTSGTTGRPKGCLSSLPSLLRYVTAKNSAHSIDAHSTVFLASSLSFDPCLGDVLATAAAGATLGIASREDIFGGDLVGALRETETTHVLCTPTLWGSAMRDVDKDDAPALEAVALGGEPIPSRVRTKWARPRRPEEEPKEMRGDDDVGGRPRRRRCLRLLATYGVTEACVYQTCGEVFADDDDDKQDNDGGGNKISGGQDVGLPLDGNVVRIIRERDHGCDDHDGEGGSERDNPDCPPRNDVDFLDFLPPGEEGEVILSGSQLDGTSGYLNLPDETAGRFLFCPSRGEDGGAGARCCHYRTGDRGVLDPATGRLRILGRIRGEEGQVKVGGVRVELSEVEGAVVGDGDDVDVAVGEKEGDSAAKGPPRIVEDCVVAAASSSARDEEGGRAAKAVLVAYCVLSQKCLEEMGLPSPASPATEGGGGKGDDEGDDASSRPRGVLVPPSHPLSVLLRTRCDRRGVRRGTVPSSFVLIHSVPLSRTGKKDRGSLPPLNECVSLSSAVMGGTGAEESGGGEEVPLRECGSSGPAVADAVTEVLNLPPSTSSSSSSSTILLTSGTNFFALGGDSLAAARVVRALYARHEGINNSRNLGGEFGVLEGAFHVSHLMRCPDLGSYVKYLDGRGVCCSAGANDTREEAVGEERIAVEEKEGADGATATAKAEEKKDDDDDARKGALGGDDGGDNDDSHGSSGDDDASVLYSALLRSAGRGLTSVALSLLRPGYADPTFGESGRRLGGGKGGTKGLSRADKRDAFRSAPLHVACARGDADLVEALLLYTGSKDEEGRKHRGCRPNAPDAGGMLPVHLACAGGGGESTIGPSLDAIDKTGKKGSDRVGGDADGGDEEEEDEDRRRLRCVRLLLEVGNVPLTSRDRNKQTVLHCAARSGHVALLRYLLGRWSSEVKPSAAKHRKKGGGGAGKGREGGGHGWLGQCDPQDRWFRTPVHWAVLNGRVRALRVLLEEGGCSPDPPRPREAVGRRRSGAAVEGPLEICDRLYGRGEGGMLPPEEGTTGWEMRRMLVKALRKGHAPRPDEASKRTVHESSPSKSQCGSGMDETAEGKEEGAMASVPAKCWERILW